MTLTPADSIEILQLVARADSCATARDADEYVELFTEDGAMTGSMGTARGRDALRRTVAQVWASEPPNTLHLTMNAVIAESDSGVSVESVMLMVGVGPSPSVIGAARVRQAVTQMPEGWRIAERSIEPAGAPT